MRADVVDDHARLDDAGPADERRHPVVAFPIGILLAGNIVVPPSGQEKDSEPLSVECITMVFSSRPSSLSLASNWPTIESCSAIPSA